MLWGEFIPDLHQISETTGCNLFLGSEGVGFWVGFGGLSCWWKCSKFCFCFGGGFGLVFFCFCLGFAGEILGQHPKGAD